jgi:hypothetical protein
VTLPVVKINSSGSDTAASGAGPGDGAAAGTALTGALAATASSTTVTITDAVNLSGVAVDGGAALWVNTASGRQWSAITAISGASGNWTVTVGTAYGVTASGQTWAIGGRRATMAGSAKLFTNGGANGDADVAGWGIDVQTGETFTAVFTLQFRTAKLANPVTVFSSAGARPVLTTATNSVNLLDLSGSNNFSLRHLALTNTAATKGTTTANGRALMSNAAGGQAVVIDDCTIDGFEVGYDSDNVTYFGMTGVHMTRCEIKNSVVDAVRSAKGMVLDWCNVHDNGGHGVLATAADSWSVSNCTFTGNAGRGWYQSAGGGSSANLVAFTSDTFAHNGAPGVEFGTALVNVGVVAAGCLFYGNTTASLKSAGGWGVFFLAKCAYEAGSLSGVPAGPSDVLLTADPRVSAADYGLNSTAGGGAAARGAAPVPPGASANAAGDIGAVPSGGGAPAAPAGSRAKVLRPPNVW